MGLRSSVALIALVTGCAASPTYTFRPSAQTAREDAPGDLEGHAASAYPVPAQSPRGEVKLAPLAVERLRLPDGRDARPLRAVHVRMVVRNGDRSVWTVDTAGQLGDFGRGPEGPVLAQLDGEETDLAVLMPGETRALDLYYELPPGLAERAALSSLRVQWSVRTPESVLARGSAAFEARVVPKPTPPPPDPKQMATRLRRASTEEPPPPPPGSGIAGGVPSWRD